MEGDSLIHPGPRRSLTKPFISHALWCPTPLLDSPPQALAKPFFPQASSTSGTWLAFPSAAPSAPFSSSSSTTASPATISFITPASLPLKETMFDAEIFSGKARQGRDFVMNWMVLDDACLWPTSDFRHGVRLGKEGLVERENLELLRSGRFYYPSCSKKRARLRWMRCWSHRSRMRMMLALAIGSGVSGQVWVSART